MSTTDAVKVVLADSCRQVSVILESLSIIKANLLKIEAFGGIVPGVFVNYNPNDLISSDKAISDAAKAAKAEDDAKAADIKIANEEIFAPLLESLGNNATNGANKMLILYSLTSGVEAQKRPYRTANLSNV